MKKLLILTSTITLLSAPSAFAKTQGNYLELDMLYANSSHKYTASNNSVARNYPKFDDSSLGLGVSYKHAFNFNKIFVAPGIFFDRIGTKAKDKDGDNIQVNNRYGLKLDIGYDITDKAAVYFTNGIARAGYNVNWDSISEKKSGTVNSYFFGAGAIYHLSDSVTVNAEYNIQSVNLATPHTGGIDKAKTTIGVAKVGIAYHF